MDDQQETTGQAAKTATLVKTMTSPVGAAQHLYRLIPPIPSYRRSEDEEASSFEFVIVSAVVAMFSGPETYIFGADANGKVLDWAELEGSYRGGLDHEKALRGAGYEVTR